MVTLKDRLTDLMRERGWGVRETARQSGLTAGGVSNLAAGRGGKPSLDSAVKLARAFGVPIESLYEISGEELERVA